MFRFIAILLLAALWASEAKGNAQQASSSDATIMKPGVIGPLKTDLFQADLLALGLPMTREETNVAGDPVTIVTVKTASSGKVEVWFDEHDRPYQLRTESSIFATEAGARVGATMAELKRLYPNGRMYLGWADGRYFSYTLGAHRSDQPTAAFEFDPDDLTTECVEHNKGCPDFSNRRSVSFLTPR